MAEPVGVDLQVGNAAETQRFVQKQLKDAKKAENSANRAESKTRQTLGQLGRTGFTAVGNTVLALAVNEAIGSLVAEQGGSANLQFAASVGTATISGFAFGGFIGGATGFLTSSISQIFSALSRANAERAELKAFIQAEKERREQQFRDSIERDQEIRAQLEESLEKIRIEERKKGFEVVQNGYQYV